MAARRRRDPRQPRFFTLASLKWIVRNRAWTPWYLIRYWRFFWLRVLHPDVVLEGFVFIGKRTKLTTRKGYGRLVIGKWCHFGEGNFIYAHEGQLRIGAKTVFGRYNTVQSYIDVEIGGKGIIADWVYICDFDHVFADIHVPITDQGLVKTPVRIGPDVWIGTKVSVLRGTTVGEGCVLASNCVVRGRVEPFSVVGGVPARLLKDRRAAYEADAQRRADIADIARKTALAAQLQARGETELIDQVAAGSGHPVEGHPAVAQSGVSHPDVSQPSVSQPSVIALPNSPADSRHPG